MVELTQAKRNVKVFFDKLGEQRFDYLKKNRYYYQDLENFYKWHIPKGSRVLEIGCGVGNLLAALEPSFGVGIDISDEMIRIASSKYSHLHFYVMDGENITLENSFDYIIISDTLGYLEDIQKLFHDLLKVSNPTTRIIITYHSFLWQPVLSLVEKLHLKMPHIHLNWLNKADITNLLTLDGFDIIKTGKRFLFPIYIPVISPLINQFVGQLPGFNALCITNFIIARPEISSQFLERAEPTVSVVVPARNEKGNIENVVKRIPHMGSNTEIIFIEGGSEDQTFDEIKRVSELYADAWTIKYFLQDGKGKGDAVRKGFSQASGDILMILDADMTVPPEDLSKFYRVIASGRGEFVNGSRLVYPMEHQAMFLLNMLGNKFFSIMFSWLLSQPLKDTLCGTKVISRDNWDRIISNRGYFGDFDPFGDFDLLFGAAKIDLKIVEIPIRYRARSYGETNISRFSHGWLLLKMVFFAMSKLKFI